MSSNVRRRDPCPCGSGKKYKNCCGKRGAKSDSKKWTGLKFSVLAFVVVGGGIAAYMILSKPASTLPEAITAEAPPKSVQPLQPQPPGPAPEGKVWSPEHSHWHDTAGSASDFATKFTPQPPGPAPEGKVWSSEHGHWHDKPVKGTLVGGNENPISISPSATPKPGGELTPQPPGPAPEGKVWSAEHGHWHDEQGTASRTPGELTPQPPGPAPEGKIWSAEHGHWHNVSGAATPFEPGTNKISITPRKPPETGSEDPE